MPSLVNDLLQLAREAEEDKALPLLREAYKAAGSDRGFLDDVARLSLRKAVSTENEYNAHNFVFIALRAAEGNEPMQHNVAAAAIAWIGKASNEHGVSYMVGYADKCAGTNHTLRAEAVAATAKRIAKSDCFIDDIMMAALPLAGTNPLFLYQIDEARAEWLADQIDSKTPLCPTQPEAAHDIFSALCRASMSGSEGPLLYKNAVFGAVVDANGETNPYLAEEKEGDAHLLFGYNMGPTTLFEELAQVPLTITSKEDLKTAILTRAKPSLS